MLAAKLLTLGASAAAVAAAAALPEPRARRLPPAASAHNITVVIPPQGALTPVSGKVDGLADAAAHVMCLYLSSRISTYNGPKPFEEADSNTPVAADGTFNYVQW